MSVTETVAIATKHRITVEIFNHDTGITEHRDAGAVYVRADGTQMTDPAEIADFERRYVHKEETHGTR